MACLPQLGSVPAAHAVVAGGWDWPLPSAVGLSNNDVIALRFLCPLRQFRYIPYVHYVACVVLNGNPAFLVDWSLRCRT